MSEFDSESGRRGFVRDVMRRISSSGPRSGDEPDSERERVMARSIHDEIEDLREAMRFFGPDSAEFRRRLDRLLAEYDALRRRYHLTRDQLVDLVADVVKNLNVV